MPSVELDGAVELRDAMHRFAPNLRENLETQMLNALNPIVRKARGFVPNQAPLSTWQTYSVKQIGKFPWFNSLEIKKGIIVDLEPTRPNRKGFAYAASIRNTTATGSIIETAGRRNPNGRKQNPMVAYAVKTGPYTQEFGGYRRDTNKKFSSSNNPNAGKQFIESLGAIYRTPRTAGMKGRRAKKMDGRLIFKAWGQDQGRANSAVLKSVDDAIREFHATTKNKFINKTKKAA